MIYGLYQSAAGMLVNQYRQDTIANNLANVDTPTYKRDIASFSERLVEAKSRLNATRNPLLDDMTGGVWSTKTATDWTEGAADVTNNSLDAMIAGPGFFAVETPEGARYTRNGQFTVNGDRRLVTAGDGFAVLNEVHQTIEVPEDAKSLRISSDGRLMVNEQPAAQLQVVNFSDQASLRKVGKGLVASSEKPDAIQAHLRVGTVERSNVEPMSEMASMIEASRAYQLNAQMLSMQDASLGRLVNEVAKPV